MKIKYQHDALRYHDPITGEYNEDINEEGVLHVNATYEVCHSCGGHGTTFRSDLDESRLIESMEEDGDEDGIDSYHQGVFDQTCSECNGQRVIPNPTLPAWAERLIGEWYRDQRVYRAICEGERRVGA